MCLEEVETGHWIPLELEFYIDGCKLPHGAGNQTQSSARATSALNCWAIPRAHCNCKLNVVIVIHAHE